MLGNALPSRETSEYLYGRSPCGKSLALQASHHLNYVCLACVQQHYTSQVIATQLGKRLDTATLPPNFKVAKRSEPRLETKHGFCASIQHVDSLLFTYTT
jgi:hypothetical protein